MHLAAFHGDFFTAAHLRQDLGNPAWVDSYVDWRRSGGWLEDLAAKPALAIVAYSRGGQIAAQLSHELPNVRAFVLYEAPTLRAGPPAGTAPALWIWNDRSWRRNTAQARESLAQWQSSGRRVDFLTGSGSHLKRSRRARTLYLAHGWDLALNDRISAWLEAQTTQLP